MSSACENAFVVWDHHEGGDIRDDDSLSIRGMTESAFKAGWAAAAGDQRLAAIEKLQRLVHECCAEETDKRFCDQFGCPTLNEIRVLLGDEVDE